MAEKIFMTYAQQIKHLKSKGLIVSNSEMPKRVLANENYYNVINGYKELFVDKDKSTEEKEVYKVGSNFSELYSLYKFDCELKAVLLKKYLFSYLNIIYKKFTYK